MISTRYGTKVHSIIGTVTDLHGQKWIVCFLHNMGGIREIHLADLRADGGAQEIDEEIKRLPADRHIDERTFKAAHSVEAIKQEWADSKLTV
jgi:hypothetical protein